MPTDANPVVSSVPPAPLPRISRTQVLQLVNDAKEEVRTATRRTTRRTIAVAAMIVLVLNGLFGGKLIYDTYAANRSFAETTGRLDNSIKELEKIAIERQKIIDDLKKENEEVKKRMQPTEMPADQVVTASKAVVKIEMGWKLIYTPTGGQLFQFYVPNLTKDDQGNDVPIVSGGYRNLAAYIQFADGTIEPYLVLDGNGGVNRPIGGEGTGTGFVVDERGFIMTNRHVAASWMSSYTFERVPGLLYRYNQEGKLVPVQVITRLPYWIPGKSRQAGNRLQGGFEGRHDYLNVTFQNTTQRIHATMSQFSDRHDVAMIKIDVPNPLTKLELLDTYDTATIGETVVTLGYPGSSPFSYGVVSSSDPFTKGTVRAVDSPTQGYGKISKILRDGQSADRKVSVYSDFGDVYQLTLMGASPGSSGSPVFNKDGKVIAVFFAGAEEENLTFAVPIRYAMELLGPKTKA
jgi:S1-C subfamily serine protease